MKLNRKVIEDLLWKAAEAAKQAHCPYSHFRVGAALLATDGSVFTACNMENASFGLSICAERASFAAAVAAGRRKFKAIAIAADGDTPPVPCGACRQVMAEFCHPDFEVIAAPVDRLHAARRFTLAELLPHPFKL